MNQKLTPKLIAYIEAIESGLIASNNALIYKKLKDQGASSSYHLEDFYEKNRIVNANGKSSLSSVSPTLRNLELLGMIRKCGQIRVLKTLYSKYEAVEGIPQMVIEANKIKLEQRNAWLENGLKNNWLTGEQVLELQAQESVYYI